ncbi:MAG: sensor histidine kinase [Eubacteriaceae bacterium]|jgi:two-component system phosphate regulon sensor histidine kinase PhoR
MNKKIFRSIFYTSILMVLGAMIVLVVSLYYYYANEQLSALKAEAVYIERGIEDDQSGFLDKLKSPDRITIIKPDGTVVVDTSEDPSTLENHANREEVKAALQDGTGTSVRYSSTLGEKTVNYALKMPDGNILRVSTMETSLWSVFLGLIQFFVIVLVVVFVISYFTARKLSEKLLKPVNELDLEHPLETEAYPELAPLLRRVEHQNKKIENQVEEARRNQKEFAAITNSMNEGIIVINPEGEVISYNHAVPELLGIAPPEQGSHILVFDRSKRFRKAVDKVLRGNKVEKKLYIGESVVQLIASPVYTDEKLTGAVIILLDITEKDNRENLRAEFVSNVSHELKTPLTSISGFAEIMKNGMVAQEDIPRFAGNIYDESQQLIGMVEDILTISKLDENRLDMPEEEVDLTELTQSVMKRLESKAADKKIKVNLDTEGNPEITGVRRILQEMIYNLLDNAIKYNRDGGSVRIVINGSREDKLTMSVADTGIGIAPGEKDRIFERFYRADKSHSKDTASGTGLGLAIVKHGANYHNAEISVFSIPNDGTSITIVFPRD